jgi:hypothetical protein
MSELTLLIMPLSVPWLLLGLGEEREFFASMKMGSCRKLFFEERWISVLEGSSNSK